ncbi:TetR/AcrR family transcriptional regulator [Zavarzinia aquatilis]|uniref:TetR/AcrR family transcriptional regulator n=1 Tax=Zavarzinia aquatilis TaxID=2211142 RepID=A0A317E2Z8_9PROT|nr:TetR/AcrR family transcriptional regulator [Zavarzinia aquatilis]PWR19475.1 TetR/AcrR family transcriptional regulator [Zavarzinia aquatilis]
MTSAPETKLLQTAQRLFCSEGIHATGVARIIREAGVARKTLYDKYGSKENLLRAVFRAEADMWFRWFDHDLPGTGADARGRILHLFDLLQHWFAGGNFFGCVFINAVAEHEKEGGWVRGIALDHRRRINERLHGLVTEAGIEDAELATEKLSLVIDGAIVTAMVTANPSVAAIGRATAADILDHALRARAH